MTDEQKEEERKLLTGGEGTKGLRKREGGCGRAYTQKHKQNSVPMIGRCVSPACELRELCCAVVLQEDIPWEWEQIFTEVSSELLTEWEQQEAPEE